MTYFLMLSPQSSQPRLTWADLTRDNDPHMTRTRWISLGILVVALAAILTAWWIKGPDGSEKSDLVQQAEPQQILDYARSLNSPLVLINFWASWCEPCKVEFPHLISLQKEFAPLGLKVVFISVDDPADLMAAEAFLKEQSVAPPTFYKGNQSLNFVTKIYPQWTGAVPATVLLGSDLQVLEGWEGETSLKSFQERVKRHLKGT
ncbi:MAG: TlpA family protein disulfide reductase [Bdellovibrionales bacterium]|nr:TlpA family protein disulfide reductase [Bdellovibrionales bacterium]